MSSVTPVTTLTKDAERDSLSESDYRDIYEELRNFVPAENRYLVSLDEFVLLISSQYSKAAWSKYHRSELKLNRVMRNELRAAFRHLHPLPPTVIEAVAAADPNAEVVQVGSDLPARRVILVATAAALTLRVNGSVAVVQQGDEGTETGGAAPVTAVTRKRSTVSLPPPAFERINAARQAHDLSWEQLLDLAVAQLGD